jgi:phage host-nuclease inhibitor protein Gam
MEYRSRLGESQTLQDFSRDAEEIEAWIADKLAAASDEPVKETQNLQVKINFLLKSVRESIIIKKTIINTWKCICI